MTNNENFFSTTAEQFSNNYNVKPDFIERIKIFEKLINKNSVNLNNNSLCMDLGCGSGEMSILLAEKGYNVIAVDGSKEMLNVAKKSTQKYNKLSIKYIYQRLPGSEDFKKKYNNKIDLLVCSSVVEYFDDYNKILELIGELLKPEGIALISFANKESIKRRYESIKKILKIIPKNHYLFYQKSQSSLRKIINFFKKLNLNVVDYKYFNFSNIFGSEKLRASMFLVVIKK